MKIKNKNWTILKTILWVTIVSLLFIGCQSPNQIRNCATQLSEVSDIRGFKIGMPLDEINKKFSGIKPKPSYSNPEFSSEIEIKSFSFGDDYSYSDGTFSANTERHPELAGVDKVTLQFIENKVSMIRVSYDETKDISFDDTFFQKLSETLNLKDNWLPASSENYERAKTIRCKDYTVKAEVYIKDIDTNKVRSGAGSDAFTYSPYVEIKLTNMEQILRDKEWEKSKQKQEKEKEKNNSFKP